MTALLVTAGVIAYLSGACLLGRYLKHISPTDAPTGRNGDPS